MMIPYGKQKISEDDIRAVVEVLKSDWITQGPNIEEFERELARYCGAKYAVAVSSGTAALHIVNIAIGVKKGDKVITTPITFVATSNSIIYAGGTPVFADIQYDTFNIDPEEIEKQIKINDNVKGIIIVHFGGLPAHIEEIKRIADRYKLWIIEDACHALGGSWIDSNGRYHKIGACSHSDMTVFSFHPVKQITTGEGGAILTNNRELYEKLMLLRTHGISKDSKILQKNDGGWYYEMHELGFNYRITDIQAVLGISQLQKNDKWVERRLEIVKKYDRAFSKIKGLSYQIHTDKERYSYHLYVIQTDKRKKLYEFLRTKGIFTQVHYIPIHLQPFYKEKFGYKKGDFPVSEEYYSKALSLPLYPSMTDEQQDYVIECVKEFYNEC